MKKSRRMLVWSAFVLGFFSADTAMAQGLFGSGRRTASNQNRSFPGKRTFNNIKNRRRGAQNKFVGGVKNILGAPVEIPAAMLRENRSSGPASALLKGTVDGVTKFVKRAGSGLVDLVTFPTKFPNKSYRNSMPPKGPVRLFRESRRSIYTNARRR